MKLKALAVVVMLFSFNAFADDVKKEGPKKDGVTTSSAWCESPECAFEGDETDTPTGPDGIATGGGGSKCVEATDYESCKTKCDCEYNKAYKKCGTYAFWCKDIATSEKNACLGLCLTDWL